MTRALTPWMSRFPRLFEWENDLPQWMADVFGPTTGLAREGKFLPEANMTETEKTVDVTVELPGMKPEEVKVEFNDNTLWVTGEKKEEKEEKGKTFHRVERRAGMFRRAFPMPQAVAQDRVDARFADGVLRISLPKVEQPTAKKIEIKT